MNEKLEKNENKKTADVLRAENLVRDYVQYGEDGEKKKEIHVLKGLNFSIQRQEFVGIMGRSGCGKTTLLKLLGMIDRQTGGKLFFEEHDTEDLWKDEFADIRRRKIGFVFQDFYLMDSLSVRENIMLPKILDKKSAKECMEESQKYAEQFGITHLMNLFTTINQEGQTIVMVTHSVKAASSAKRVLFIKDGKVFHQLYRGNLTNEEMYERISDTLKILTTGGEEDE